MSLKNLKIFFLACTASFLLGCSRNEQLDALMKENPFPKKETAAAIAESPIILVGCEYIPIQFPAAVKIDDLEHWPDDESNNAGKYFPPDQIEVWKQNGICVITAPVQQWPQLRQDLVDAGGNTLSQATSIFRNRNEHADFPAAWQNKTESIFISDAAGNLKGQTVGPGQAGFRVICQLPPDQPNGDLLYINITPIFLSPNTIDRIERDSFGAVRRVTERPELIFDELTLKGVVPTDVFIAITLCNNDDQSTTLGKCFMTSDPNALNAQLFCLIVPQTEFAARPASPAKIR